jgi:hypothetical protein
VAVDDEASTIKQQDNLFIYLFIYLFIPERIVHSPPQISDGGGCLHM